MGPQQQNHSCRFAAVAGQAGDIDQFLQQWQVNAGSATFLAYVGSRTQTCYITKYHNRTTTNASQ